MKIAIGADHGGFELKEALIAHLRGAEHEVLDLGTSSREAVDYPDYARAVAEAVASGRIERGIVVDGAGIGSAMVANKVPGVRAALAYDLSSARNGREHNDANVLTLGASLIGAGLARQLVDVFLSTDCTEDRHLRRVAKISALDDKSVTSTGVPTPTGATLPLATPPAPGPVSAADLSDSDLARIIDRLETLVGGGGAVADVMAGAMAGAVAGSTTAAMTAAGPSVATSPATARRLLALGVERLSHGPDAAGTVPDDIAGYIDHTLLKPDATRAQILRVCDEAREYAFKAVCVNPCWVSTVASALRGCSVLTCAVVGFPLGASTSAIKGFEARRAIRDGAREIDMVINIGALKSGDEDLVLKDIRAVTEACRDGSARSKVIIETALLDEAEKVRACELARLARADFVKTSTGFAGGGATIEDVALMARVVGGAGMEVKASGGIKNFDDTMNMIEAGATRIGASAGVAIVQEARGRNETPALREAR